LALMAICLDISGLSYDECILALTAQGLLNRKGPRVFLKTGSLFWQYREADDWWMDYYSRRKGIRFEEAKSLDELLLRFLPEFRGLCLFDPSLDATRYVALTLCGLEGLLPSSTELLGRHPPLGKLPVSHDLRGRWGNDVEAYEWAIEKLLPRTDRKVCFSAGRSHEGKNLGYDPSVVLGLDYVIMRGGFVFNLSPAAEYPEDARLLDKIMGRLSSPASVYGWAEPEGQFVERVSKWGNFIMCACAPNLSFHSKVPAKRGFRYKWGHKGPGEVRLERKYYVAFLTNEGDTPKIAVGLMGGAWLAKWRGKVAVNWGLNPLIALEFPAVFEMYQETATERDYFFGGVSGAGYCLLHLLPNLEAYAKHVRRCLEASDVRIFDVWGDPGREEAYCRIVRPLGLTHSPFGRARLEFAAGEFPILFPDGLSGVWYFEAKKPEELAEKIKTTAYEHPPPFFIVVYGGLGAGSWMDFEKVADLLDPSKFKVVRLDEMMALAKIAGRAMLRLPQPPVHLLGEEVWPGGEEILAYVELRASAGKPLPSGEVRIPLPKGWRSRPEKKKFPPLGRGEEARLEFRITPPKEGRGVFHLWPLISIPGETFHGMGERVRVVEWSPLFEPHGGEVFCGFETGEGWEETGAKLSLKGGVGKITQADPRVYWGSVRRKFEVDLERAPLLVISVPEVEEQWALKVNDGTLPSDIPLVKDTQKRGIFVVDLKGATGWRGRKEFWLIIFAVGRGKSVKVDWLKFCGWEGV